MTQEKDRQIQELTIEVERLRIYEKIVGTQSIAGAAFAKLTALIAIGPDLTQSLIPIIENSRSGAHSTTNEWANLFAAAFRRLVRIGIFGIILTSLPTIILIWQNLLIRQQNESLINQINADKQSDENARYHEYLRALLGPSEEGFWGAIPYFQTLPNELSKDPVAPQIQANKISTLRVLADTVTMAKGDVACRAFIGLAKLLPAETLPYTNPTSNLAKAITKAGRGQEPQSLRCDSMILKDVNLNSVSFVNAQLPNLRISNTTITNTDFRGANLSGASFGPNISGNALFANANLTNADFSRMESDDFATTNFDNAKLVGAAFPFSNALAAQLKIGFCTDEEELLTCHPLAALNRGVNKPDRGGFPCRNYGIFPMFVIGPSHADRKECQSQIEQPNF